MPDRRASFALIAGLILASPSLLDAVAHRLILCQPQAWAPAIVVGVNLGLLAFVALTASRVDLRHVPVRAVHSLQAKVPAANA